MSAAKRYDYEQFRKFSINKQNRQNVVHFYQNNRFFSKQNNVYQENSQNQNEQRLRIKIIVKINNTKEKSNDREIFYKKLIDTNK